jgi:hypothetical protein
MEFKTARHTIGISCLITLGLFATPARAQWADKLFDTTSFDFGTVALGQNLKHTFKITNELDKPLHIMRAYPTASVIRIARPEREWLAPGESVGLKVDCNTLRFQPGKKSVGIDVVFDRPAYGSVKLLVSLHIRSDIVVNPPEIAFGDVAKGKVASRSMAIEYAGDLTWKIASASCMNPHLEVHLEERHREKSEKGFATVGYELRVSLRPDAPAGIIDDRVKLEINDAARKSIDLLVTGRIVDEPVRVPNP